MFLQADLACEQGEATEDKAYKREGHRKVNEVSEPKGGHGRGFICSVIIHMQCHPRLVGDQGRRIHRHLLALLGGCPHCPKGALAAVPSLKLAGA